MWAQAPDGGGRGGGRSRPEPTPAKTEGSAAPTSPADADLAATLGPVPPPLPDDPGLRAALRERLERGLAAAESGEGEDWEVVHARLRARLNLPPR